MPRSTVGRKDFQTVTAEGFPSTCSNGVELHKRTYYDLRAQFPDLPAQLVCAARVKVTEAVKSALAKKVAAYSKRVAKAKKMGWKIPVFKPVKCPTIPTECARTDSL